MLTEKTISQSKPQDRTYRLHDRNGLYLEVAPNGGKLWRFKYRLNGKENRCSLGVYPLVTLKDAREKVFEYRKLVAQGVKPGGQRKPYSHSGLSFEAVAHEWFDKFMALKKTSYPGTVKSRLEREVYPFIGTQPIAEINPQEVASK